MCGHDYDNYFDDYLDDDEWPEGSEVCDRCNGDGIASCYCGGDLCFCENRGEMECPLCAGVGHWVPTEAYKQQRADMAALMKRMFADDRPADH